MYVKLLDNIAAEIALAFEAATDKTLSVVEARGSLSFCDIEFGDLASNIALVMAKKLKQAPRDIAQRLAQELARAESIKNVEVAGPGFVNLRLSDGVWAELFAALQPDYFQTDTGAGKSVNVEFISANPTGPLVLVNAWGGYYGDVLASLYESQGYRVSREYYLNDGGNQIRQLGKAVQQAAGAKFSEEESAVLYRGDYVDRLAQQIGSELGSAQALIEADTQMIGDKAKAEILDEYIRPTLKTLGIHHDVIYPESTLDNQATLNRLQAMRALKEADGAVWLDAERVGLDKDEVLVRSTDHEETYFLKDISYQLTKLEDRKFDLAITIVGPDHHGQEQRLLAALRLLGADGFVPLWTQTVRLTKDGKEYKMSKRRGNYIVLDDFLELVPSDTARFFFALRDTNSHFDLDLDLVSAQNKHNPLYYVMYAYVRAGSVLAKAGSYQKPSTYTFDDTQKQMLRGFLLEAELIRQATENYQVHPVLYQMIELARSFHDWYDRNPIANEEDSQLRAQRLAFVEAYRQAFHSLFTLIGIQPLEKM